ncbi:MAG TPA: tetratricopeptide repeat protein [Candidatus Sulfomarinibacteraceae bacterium]|nr:tetratricopeptide repeat protein [Candidatus Sulfomarinibacteraceae bacterium]
MLVTRTKVITPGRRSDLLSRPRLLGLLQRLIDYKLIVISAPAGYGKTSLLVDYAESADLPVCWYALDHLDQNPQRFVAHLVASLQEQFDGLGGLSQAAQSNGEFDLDRAVATVANEVYEHVREHFVLVLDDYHLVESCSDINYVVNQLLLHLDENAHIIVSSRTLPALPDMSLFVGRNQVGGLDFETLAFRTGEIQSLMEQNYNLIVPDQDADRIAEETEGWITGLLLSAQTMWQGMIEQLQHARVSGVDLYDYLAQQVLSRQPEHIQEFLLHTSLLEEFDADLCRDVLEEILGSLNWQELIDNIARSNLFVLPVSHGWVRYHHLFRDFLQSRLTKQQPDRVQEIRRRLAAVYEERGEWEQAHDLYQQLGDVEATAALVEQAGSHMAQQGQIATLAKWLDALPVMLLSPALKSLQGIVMAMRGQQERGMALLDDAIEQLEREENWELLPSALVRRATVRRFAGQYGRSIEDADAAIQIVGEHKTSQQIIVAEALRVKGTCCSRRGELNAALHSLNQAQAIYQSLHDKSNMALVQQDLGVIYEATGQYEQARNAYVDSLSYYRQAGDHLRLATVLNNLGVVNHLTGQYEEAWEQLSEALECARRSGYTRKEAVILASIGDLYADLDIEEAARDAYYQARELAERVQDRFLCLYLTLAQAGLALKEEDFALADYLLQTGRDLTNREAPFEMALYQQACGRVALAQDRLEEAICHLESAATAFGEGQPVHGAHSHFALALARFGNGQKEAALADLRQAFRLAPDLDQYILVVAARAAQPLLEAAHEDPQLRYRAGHLRKKVEKFERDLPILRRFLRQRALPSISFGPPELVVRALGGEEVWLDGTLITISDWQTRTARDLFFLLLARPEGLTKEGIGLEIWPEADPGQLKTRFKNAIYRVRRALGQDVIQFGDDHLYSFNWAMDYKYDAQAFENTLNKARAETRPDRRVALYESALSMYGGDYLPDVDQEWVIPIRENLRQMQMNAALTLAQHHLELQEFRNALQWTQQLLDEDPCHEEAHRLAMRAYAALGNRSGVARQFQICRDALWEQVQVPPSPQTLTLYERLVQ